MSALSIQGFLSPDMKKRIPDHFYKFYCKRRRSDVEYMAYTRTAHRLKISRQTIQIYAAQGFKLILFVCEVEDKKQAIWLRIVPRKTCCCNSKQLSCSNEGKPLSANQKSVPDTLGNLTVLNCAGFFKDSGAIPTRQGPRLT